MRDDGTITPNCRRTREYRERLSRMKIMARKKFWTLNAFTFLCCLTRRGSA